MEFPHSGWQEVRSNWMASSQANSFLKPMKDPFRGPHTRKSISFPQKAGHGTRGPNPCLTWDCYLVHAHALDAGGLEAVTTAATWIKAVVFLASLGCSSAWQTSSGVTSLQPDQLNICSYLGTGCIRANTGDTVIRHEALAAKGQSS